VRPVSGVPVEPDADTARRWLLDELADPVYEAAEPGVVDRVVRWFLELLSDLEVPGGPGGAGLAVLLAAVALVAVLAVRAGGPLLGRRSAAGEAVLPETQVTAEEHRSRARRAEVEGRPDDAAREWFRATVRGSEERTLLAERPGRTADEAAREAGALLPDLAERLAAGALAFDTVTYGGRHADQRTVAMLRDLDAAVAAARPRHDHATAAPAAAP
jgi:hypothetical protein